jgi:hypothetical protein
MKNLEINFAQFGAWEGFEIIYFVYVIFIYRILFWGFYVKFLKYHASTK